MWHDVPMPFVDTAAGRFVTFDREDRADQLARMVRQPLDVLVIGGGITGVGCALDAVARGLRVGIVEADDWAAGTSSRSSKMIHGGLRYLATGDIGVVRDSLRERKAIQRNAAHLVRPLSMLLPVYGRGPIPYDRMKIGAGLWLYELLGHRAAAGGMHTWRPLEELVRMVPNIATTSDVAGGRLRGALHYHDASADDCRLVLAVLRSAVARGAMAVNGARVQRLLRDGDRVTGAVVRSDVAEAEVELEARVVVNATGVWADGVLADAGERVTDSGFRLAPSKGIHVAVRRDRAGIESGVAFFEHLGNANVFLEPWQDDLVFIGTTDAPYDGDLARPEATEDEIDWLLRTAGQFLRDPLRREDVVATWAGLRPLVEKTGGEGASKDVSRRHLLVDDPGVVTITGGKLTAYRSMAQVAIDAAARQLGVRTKSSTLRLALDGCRSLATPSEIEALAVRFGGIERAQVRHLLRRHGSNVEGLAQLVDADPALADRLHPERPYLAVEALWATRYEQARDVEDIVQRRTRIGIETSDPQLATAAIEAALGTTAVDVA